MKLFKSLLLGSAAGLVAVSGASAADLGIKKPTAAVEYVRVCSAHGAGFFYIPGSDVCMQISGRVRAEYMIGSTWNKTDDVSSFRAHGRINLDVRQTTQYGLLRAYIRMEQYADTGRYYGAFGPSNYTGGAAVSTYNSTNQLATYGGILNKAFIQFYTGTAGFFTAGRSVSFFDFYANDANYGRMVGSDRDNSNLFAYTFTFGGGLTATLSVEDAYNRRLGLGYPYGLNPVPAANIYYGSQKMPDIVANVRIDQAWGSAQLSGALHQVNLVSYTAPVAPADYLSRGTKYGWAIQGGVKINLPMIAAGDVLWVQAAYAKGANDYAGVTRYAGDAAPFGALRNTVFPAGVDAYSVGGVTKLSNSWSILSAFVHNFTPTVQGALYAGYGRFDAPTGSAGRDFNAYSVGGRLNWIPVRNFTIGAEVMYNVLDPKGMGVAIAGQSAKGKYDSVTARIRFQREF